MNQKAPSEPKLTTATVEDINSIDERIKVGHRNVQKVKLERKMLLFRLAICFEEGRKGTIY